MYVTTCVAMVHLKGNVTSAHISWSSNESSSYAVRGLVKSTCLSVIATQKSHNAVLCNSTQYSSHRFFPRVYFISSFYYLILAVCAEFNNLPYLFEKDIFNLLRFVCWYMMQILIVN